MKKKWMFAVLIAMLVGSLGITSNAYAQSQEPECPGDCASHDEVLAIFSEKLGIPVEQLQARLESGERLAQVALSEGLSFDEFRSLMPMKNFAQRAAGFFGRGARRSTTSPGSTYGMRACINNADCTPSYWGQQSGGQGAGRGR